MTPAARSAFSLQVATLIRCAFEEDLGPAGDVSARLLEKPDELVSAQLVARSAGVLSGAALAPEILRIFYERGAAPPASIQLDFSPAGGAPRPDGARFEPRESIATLRGQRAALLALERTLLNFLSRLCGVASLTRRFVDAARSANPQVRVLDTRKTLPGWRELDKYAVRCGGGENHRLGLYDAVLLKDNHLAGIQTAHLAAALRQMLARIETPPSFVQVEVDSLEQLQQVLEVDGIDYVMLDNFEQAALRHAVALRDARGRRGRVELEASGGVTLETIAAIAATGVERISIGALTHSAPSLDIGLDF